MSLIYRSHCVFLFLSLIYSAIPYAAMTGKEIYEQHCHICHASGLAGAPKFRDEADWTGRCDEKHLSGLVSSAIKGINAMPAKGTCEACQILDIRHAIEYMVPHNEKKCQ